MAFLVLGVATFIGAWLWPKATSACLADEKTIKCVREWMSASSGYLATIAAAFTLVFLYKQVAEQKKQTEFLLGDASPTIDTIRHQKSADTAVIRIVNWNRRPILIKRIKLRSPMELETVSLADVQIFGQERSRGLVPRELHGETIMPAIAMHGWKDRSEQPCEIRIDVAAQTLHGNHVTDWSGVIVEIGAVMAGESQKSLILTSPVAAAD